MRLEDERREAKAKSVDAKMFCASVALDRLIRLMFLYKALEMPKHWRI